jgi:hypothetical protein
MKEKFQSFWELGSPDQIDFNNGHIFGVFLFVTAVTFTGLDHFCQHGTASAILSIKC